MDTFKFTKEHTQISKGIAMILMLFLHLYCWMDFEKYVAFVKLPNGHDIPWLIGSVGNICVSMFLFLSGYGMYCVQKKKQTFSLKDALIRIKNIWVQYALITVVIIALSLIFKKVDLNFGCMALNLLGLDYTYNKFAWFIITYIVIMLVFPIINKIYKRIPLILEIVGIVGIKVLITVINHVLQSSIGVNPVAYRSLIEPFMFLPVFLIGYICAEYMIFEKIMQFLNKRACRYKKMILVALLIIVYAFILLEQDTIFDNITAPIICFTVAYIFYGTVFEKFLCYMGKHSTNMWLIHYPIMITFIPNIIYAPKYWLLILIWIILIMLPFCYLIDWIVGKINGVKKN